MPTQDISPAVKALIAERIDSVPELEAVLLLRESGGRQWTAAEAGRRLYVSTTVATHILEVLSERGLFARTGETYRYEPSSTELAAAVDDLASTYTRYLVAVTQLIHSKPSQSIRQFAEAFRLRKDT